MLWGIGLWGHGAGVEGRYGFVGRVRACGVRVWGSSRRVGVGPMGSSSGSGGRAGMGLFRQGAMAGVEGLMGMGGWHHQYKLDDAGSRLPLSLSLTLPEAFSTTSLLRYSSSAVIPRL